MAAPSQSGSPYRLSLWAMFVGAVVIVYATTRPLSVVAGWDETVEVSFSEPLKLLLWGYAGLLVAWAARALGWISSKPVRLWVAVLAGFPALVAAKVMAEDISAEAYDRVGYDGMTHPGGITMLVGLAIAIVAGCTASVLQPRTRTLPPPSISPPSSTLPPPATLPPPGGHASDATG